MSKTSIRFSSFPRTEPPPEFIQPTIEVLCKHEQSIATTKLAKGLTSDAVLGVLRDDLVAIGFDVESGKAKAEKIERPVFYGEDGIPILLYQIDAYHPAWRCGLEVEAGRAWKGNAVYRDLIQAMVMVQVDHLCLAVPNQYKYLLHGKEASSSDYNNTIAVADALFGHSRISVPYGLTVVGY